MAPTRSGSKSSRISKSAGCKLTSKTAVATTSESRELRLSRRLLMKKDQTEELIVVPVRTMGGKVLLRNQRDHPVRKESQLHLNKRETENHRHLKERKLRRNRNTHWTNLTMMMLKNHRHNEREFRRNRNTHWTNLAMIMRKNYRMIQLMLMRPRPNRMKREKED